MKVKCIDASYCGKELTVGKTYNVPGGPTMSSYFIECDDSTSRWFQKSRFEVVQDEHFNSLTRLTAELGAAQKERDEARAEVAKWRRSFGGHLYVTTADYSKALDSARTEGFNAGIEAAAKAVDESGGIDSYARLNLVVAVRALKPEPKADLRAEGIECRDALAKAIRPMVTVGAKPGCTCGHGPDWHTTYVGCVYESSDRFGDHICPCKWDGKS